jgi:hypothetical protein
VEFVMMLELVLLNTACLALFLEFAARAPAVAEDCPWAE